MLQNAACMLQILVEHGAASVEKYCLPTDYKPENFLKWTSDQIHSIVMKIQ